jgi:cysteinyl-tRNA synthetase
MPLEAGSAGERPVGVAEGPAGHGDGAGYLPHDRAGSPDAPLSPAGRDLHDRFVAAIDDDLDLPVALALVREIARAKLPPEERRWLILDADLVLGLDLHHAWDVLADDAGASVPDQVSDLVAQRMTARQARDFARSDAIREELSNIGWDVIDEAGGSRVQRRARSR